MFGRLLVGILLLCAGPGTLVAADEPKLPDVATFDKLVVDALREVHNRGADLYNMGREYDAAYRMYQGGLVAVRPLLAHRPSAQKLIDEGLAGADKEALADRKAFKLHETIELVRKHLKEANEPSKPVEPKPKQPIETAPNPKEKKDDKKPVDVKKPIEVKKPKDPDPKPMGTTTGPAGKVSLQGKPLTAAEVTLVSLGQAKPRVFTAAIQADGSYKFAEPIPPGQYVVIVTAKNIPEKYQLTTSSGLVIDVKAGGNYDIDLK